MPDSKLAFLALSRFGFGARADDLARVSGDPRGALHAELDAPGVALVSPAGLATSELMGTSAALELAFDDIEKRKMERAARQAAMGWADLAEEGFRRVGAPGIGPAPERAMTAQAAGAPTGGGNRPQPFGGARQNRPLPIEQRVFRAEARARFDKVVAADIGFVERLVHFWSNHFCVSARKSQLLRVTAGAFEREAIRPHVLGRFADMLRAVTKHPAMLYYLDNQASIGPGSRAGKTRNRGINENLAREILELHTLGVDGGYTQRDVTEFARVLTGWTVVGRQGRLGAPGTFIFNANAHEPGDERVLGSTYSGGLRQGESVLEDIARHPATAAHIATKLARHFVADDPPTALVERLKRRFLETGGDLRAMAVGLIEAPECWSAAPTKLRSPYDFLLAAKRAIDPLPVAEPNPILGGLNLLGQPLWQPPGPNGFPDTTAAWLSAEGMKVRLDLSAQIGRQAKGMGRPGDLVDAVLGAGASGETRLAVSRAESKPLAVAILLMSPEFQRR